ncbi:hypothetical protein [Pseudoalteromonas sp. MTN2-4]|uniref:hypothetical protein n=1 Tax=Pseudoalteromonas sp. MTN2-4 TaxID=3056555 RepID=UPI0036F4331C
MNNKESRYQQEKARFYGIAKQVCSSNLIESQLDKAFSHWLAYRKLHADFLINGPESQFYLNCDVSFEDSVEVENKNIFFLFHYGPYFSVPLHFVKKFNFSGAAFILTSQSIDFGLVEKCAQAFGSELEPIVIDESGLFVKKVLKAKKAGKCIFILVDLPAGSDDKNYKMFDTHFGKIKHRLGYMRIASMLKQKPSLILPQVSNDYKKMSIGQVEINSHDEVVDEYVKLLGNDFKNFERVNELERMCEFK